MATATEVRVNRIVLNRGADLFFEGENVFVPLGHYAAKDLADVLSVIGDDRIVVTYTTVADSKEQAKDMAKYTKRLSSLDGAWSRTDWTNGVIRGFVQDQRIECVLTRVR